jgi:hypothetical protein
MSMLDRYRRKGGFVQLLMLLETCGPAKQEKFLEIIRAEDPRWADGIKQKMLNIERIYSWSDEVLAEIFGALQDLTIATALHPMSAEMRERVHRISGHSRWRRIEDLFTTSTPKPEEIATMHMKIMEAVRSLNREGKIRFDKVDPSLIIEDAIEDKLSKEGAAHDFAATGSASSKLDADDARESTSASSAADSGSHAPTLSDTERAELSTLRKKFTELTKETAVLRQELSVARHKLEQIRKIA